MTKRDQFEEAIRVREPGAVVELTRYPDGEETVSARVPCPSDAYEMLLVINAIEGQVARLHPICNGWSRRVTLADGDWLTVYVPLA